MNIFLLDKDPHIAATYLCDKHVGSQLRETAQLLCSPYEPGEAPYKRTHYNHPCAKWVRSSLGAYIWTVVHGLAIAEQWELRYGTPHKSIKVVEWAAENCTLVPVESMLVGAPLDFVQCVSDACLREDPVEAYRAYYRQEKAHMAKWAKGVPMPEWFIA